MRAWDLIYTGGALRRVGELEAFRGRAQAGSAVHEGLVYRTWSLGEGDVAAVFLPGSMGHGEVWFPQMTALEGKMRAVAISLPECKTLGQAARGVMEAVSAMGISRYVVVGYSLGGLVAQLAIREDGARALGAALCLTGAPSRDLPPEILLRWQKRRAMALRMRLTRFTGVARLTMSQQAFAANCPPGAENDLDFWRAFIEDTYFNYLYKKQYINLNYIAQPALYQERPFSPGDLDDWPGKMLIVHSEEDRIYAPETQYLRSLYPKARAVPMSGGQFALLAHEEEATRLLVEFCEEAAGRR